MSNSFFLWPDHSRPIRSDYVKSAIEADTIEKKLKEIYSDCEPVLFSSARAGLNAVLVKLNLSRQNLVWLPEYSSHCLLDAISRQCTPTPVETENISVAINYHQWGNVFTTKFAPGVTVIEDAVDSFFIPGTSPFALQSDFVLWSLPKVFGVVAGGVVFCRDKTFASQLRNLRNDRPCSIFQSFLRLRGHSSRIYFDYWNGIEAAQGGLSFFFLNQILRQLERIAELVDDRVRLLNFVSDDIADTYLKIGRFPSNIPLVIPEAWESVWGENQMLTAGLRSFNTLRESPNSSWVKVAPLPVHAGVSQETISQVLTQLRKGDGSYEFEII